MKSIIDDICYIIGLSYRQFLCFECQGKTLPQLTLSEKEFVVIPTSSFCI